MYIHNQIQIFIFVIAHILHHNATAMEKSHVTAFSMFEWMNEWMNEWINVWTVILTKKEQNLEQGYRVAWYYLLLGWWWEMGEQNRGQSPSCLRLGPMWFSNFMQKVIVVWAGRLNGIEIVDAVGQRRMWIPKRGKIEQKVFFCEKFKSVNVIACNVLLSNVWWFTYWTLNGST